jgi:hypothetical protein
LPGVSTFAGVSTFGFWPAFDRFQPRTQGGDFRSGLFLLARQFVDPRLQRTLLGRERLPRLRRRIRLGFDLFGLDNGLLDRFDDSAGASSRRLRNSVRLSSVPRGCGDATGSATDSAAATDSLMRYPLSVNETLRERKSNRRAIARCS